MYLPLNTTQVYFLLYIGLELVFILHFMEMPHIWQAKHTIQNVKIFLLDWFWIHSHTLFFSICEMKGWMLECGVWQSSNFVMMTEFNSCLGSNIDHKWFCSDKIISLIYNTINSFRGISTLLLFVIFLLLKIIVELVLCWWTWNIQPLNLD